MAFRWGPPASFFAINLGLTGLGSSWRIAADLWHLPKWIGEAILGLDVAVWALLLLGYIAKIIWQNAAFRDEFNHPISCCFIGLIPTATMAVAFAVHPYSEMAQFIFFAGLIAQIVFVVHRTGTLWKGNREPADTSPVAYLPAVAGGFVAAGVSANFGYHDLGVLCFGVALFSWFAYESVILRRLMEVPSLPPALRPVIGIFFAPPLVGCAAYLSLTSGRPDFMAKAMLGYGMFEALVILRLWWREGGFAASYWAFTFATSALAICLLNFLRRGESGVYEWLAVGAFAIANVVIGAIIIGTLWLLVRGKLFPVGATSDLKKAT
jgi:tellurite resistance protein